MSDDEPCIAPTRIVGLDEIHRRRGKRVWVVHQPTNLIMSGNSFTGYHENSIERYSHVHIYSWTVGPIIIRRMGQDVIWDPSGMDRVSRPTYMYTEGCLDTEDVIDMRPFLVENGDWTNDIRTDITLLSLIEYNVVPGFELDRFMCNAIFDTQAQADLWGVTIRLSYSDPLPFVQSRPRRFGRYLANRNSLKRSIFNDQLEEDPDALTI